MIDLYHKFIHYNGYSKKWCCFDRSEAVQYMNDRNKMKTLKEYNTVEDLIKDHKIKEND